jgi:hypothetical protein
MFLYCTTVLKFFLSWAAIIYRKRASNASMVMSKPNLTWPDSPAVCKLPAIAKLSISEAHLRDRFPDVAETRKSDVFFRRKSEFGRCKSECTRGGSKPRKWWGMWRRVPASGVRHKVGLVGKNVSRRTRRSGSFFRVTKPHCHHCFFGSWQDWLFLSFLFNFLI